MRGGRHENEVISAIVIHGCQPFAMWAFNARKIPSHLIILAFIVTLIVPDPVL